MQNQAQQPDIENEQNSLDVEAEAAAFDDGFDAAFADEPPAKPATTVSEDAAAHAEISGDTSQIDLASQEQDTPVFDANGNTEKALSDLQTQLDAANHTARSSQGRELSHKRKLEEIEQENKALKEKIQTTGNVEAATENDQDGNSDDEDVADLMNDFPGMERFIKAQVDEKTQPLQDKLQKYQEAGDQQATQQLVDAENTKNAQAFAVVDTVRETHSDFDEVVKRESYGSWYYAQDASTRAMAESGDPAQMSGLISQFKNSQNKRSDKRNTQMQAMTGAGGRRGNSKLQGKAEVDVFDDAFEKAFNSE